MAQVSDMLTMARARQSRSSETRRLILTAALNEFADKGFDGASTRAIGERANVHPTLITYHFGTKDRLWRSTAEHFFGEIQQRLARKDQYSQPLEPIDRVRGFFRGLLLFSVENPTFHHFMVRESREGGSRLPWLMDTFLAPVMRDMIPEIEAAQTEGDLPLGQPTLIYYFMLGIVSVLAALGPEIRYNSRLAIDTEAIVDEYWTIVDQIVFRRKSFKDR